MNTDSTATPDRTEANLDAFIELEPSAGGITLRPFSAGTLTLCRSLGLTMITGSGKEPIEAMSADEKQRQITTFLFIQSQPLDVVKKAVKLAREDRAAFEEQYLLPFELEMPVTAMFETMGQLEKSLVSIEAAQIEVLQRPGGRSREVAQPPAN